MQKKHNGAVLEQMKYLSTALLIALLAFFLVNLWSSGGCAHKDALSTLKMDLKGVDKVEALNIMEKHLESNPDDRAAMLMKWRLGGGLSVQEERMVAPVIRRWLLESPLDTPQQAMEVFISALVSVSWPDISSASSGALLRTVIPDGISSENLEKLKETFRKKRITLGDMQLLGMREDEDKFIFTVILPIHTAPDVLEKVTDVQNLQSGIRSYTRTYNVIVKSTGKSWRVERMVSTLQNKSL